MQRVIGVVVSAILGVFLLALAWLNGAIMEFPLPGQLMAARSAERLTAAACNGNADCISEKAPIASYAEYRRCGGYIESERAGESRLACSEAWLSDVYMRSGGEGSSFYRHFRRACRVHDFCYVHAEATYDPKYGKGPAQDRCDRMLLADIVRDCRLLYPTAKLHDDRMKCFRNAMAAYTGVRLQGSKSFSSAKPALCDYEPGPHAPRDHVISGRFVKGRPESLATIVEEPDFRGISVELHALSGDGGSKPILPVARFTPKDVAVADRDRACELPEWSAADTCTAPSTLGDAGFQSADWLRFAPIVGPTVTNLFTKDAVLLATVSNKPRTDTAGIRDYFVSFLKGSPVGTINTSSYKFDCNSVARLGTWTVTLTDAATGVKTDVKARYSFIYRMEGGKWKVDHLHSSMMPEKAG